MTFVKVYKELLGLFIGLCCWWINTPVWCLSL